MTYLSYNHVLRRLIKWLQGEGRISPVVLTNTAYRAIGIPLENREPPSKTEDGYFAANLRYAFLLDQIDFARRLEESLGLEMENHPFKDRFAGRYKGVLGMFDEKKAVPFWVEVEPAEKYTFRVKVWSRDPHVTKRIAVKVDRLHSGMIWDTALKPQYAMV